MNGAGVIDRIYQRSNSGSAKRTPLSNLTIGVVVDTNDPQQMGRVRAVCTALGDPQDPNEYKLEDIPWAQYCSPFGGMIENAPRGPNGEQTEGGVAYGWWNPPRVGAQVLVTCIDGDPQYRIYMGCLFGQFTPHTMPHGRHSYNIPVEGSTTLDGPLSSGEQNIQPLYDNQTEAFVDRESIEWATRGADYSASALDPQNVLTSLSQNSDDKDHNVNLPNGEQRTRREGYALDRINRQRLYETTGNRYDNQVHSWTSPGFHAISMDDRPENCRMRFRTSTGHQVILDDTNERIYLSTAEGKNWIEMDQKGNLDIYGEQKISLHSDSDVNIDASNIRLTGENIHLNASNELRLTSGNDLHTKSSNGNLRFYAGQSLFTESVQSTNMLTSSGDFLLTSGGSLGITSTGETTIDCSNYNCRGSAINLDGITNGAFVGNLIGDVTGKATMADQAGIAGAANPAVVSVSIVSNSQPPPTVSSPTPAPSSDVINANLTSRSPQHEPWPRMSFTLDLTDVSSPGQTPQQVLEHAPTSISVNLIDHGITFDRNPLWLR